MKLLKRLSNQDPQRNNYKEADSILKKDSFKEAVEEVRKAKNKEYKRKLDNELKLMEVNDIGAAVDRIHEKVLAGENLSDGELKLLGVVKV